MNKNLKIYIGGFALIAVFVIIVLAWGNANGDAFGGADDGAEDVVAEVDPGFEAWWDGIWGDYELPGETESLLFAVQAAIGAIIIGYFIGRTVQKKKEAKMAEE